MGADVHNDLLSSDNLEKHWIRAGPEFLAEQGKVFICIRALCGLKYASADFRSFMSNKLDEVVFKYIPVDSDVWLRPAIKLCGE